MCQDKDGAQVSKPVPVNGSSSGSTESLFMDMQECVKGIGSEAQTKDVKFRAVYDGGPNAAGASAPVSAQFLHPFRGGVGAPTDAMQAVGPVNLDLLTGHFTVSRTDVSIPVPGTEATLEFTRTYNSNYSGLESKPVSGVLGYSWQPSAPVERNMKGKPGLSCGERHEDAIDAVYDEECLEEEFTQVECMVEEAIPAADWVELLTSEGTGAVFETHGYGNYGAPEYMREWVLKKDSNASPPTFELVGPEGTHTVFQQNAAPETTSYRPKTVSWQATSKSSRYAYELYLAKYRLKQIIAPAPPGVNCSSDTQITETEGCRSLMFEYYDGFPNAEKAGLSGSSTSTQPATRLAPKE